MRNGSATRLCPPVPPAIVLEQILDPLVVLRRQEVLVKGNRAAGRVTDVAVDVVFVVRLEPGDGQHIDEDVQPTVAGPGGM